MRRAVVVLLLAILGCAAMVVERTDEVEDIGAVSTPLGEDMGRRAGGISTMGSFSLSSSGNTAGNDEALRLEALRLGDSESAGNPASKMAEKLLSSKVHALADKSTNGVELGLAKGGVYSAAVASCNCGGGPTWAKSQKPPAGDCKKYVGRRRAAGVAACKTEGERRRRAARRRRVPKTALPGEDCTSCFEECGHRLAISDFSKKTGTCWSGAYMPETSCKGMCFPKSEGTRVASPADKETICTKICTVTSNMMLPELKTWAAARRRRRGVSHDLSHVKCALHKTVDCTAKSGMTCSVKKKLECLTVCAATAPTGPVALAGAIEDTCDASKCDGSYCAVMAQFN
jgi:hypothetical protein